VPNRTGVDRIAINDGDRQLRRTCMRFGEELRALRIRAGISQAALARAIGVSRSVICRMEQGATDVSAQIRARAVSALGGDFRIALYPGGAPLIHDAAHARIVEAMLRMHDRSWHVTLESPVPGPGRRSTDIRLDRGNETVLIEVETRIHALEGIIREGAEKRAAVAGAVSALGSIHVVLVLPSTRHHRALVKAHPGIVAAAFPADQASLAQALASPDVPWPGDGILWITVPTDRQPAAAPMRVRPHVTGPVRPRPTHGPPPP
jgi:transcriptional regulator with XRE-family HTH domain